MPNVRMSIDVPKELHKAIKAHSALKEETIKDYVVEAIVERMHKDRALNQLTTKTLQDSDNNKGLKIYGNLEELYKKLGI